jgi:exopolysaccharide biosynthesis polyprenyl glycosylphosphotransferase
MDLARAHKLSRIADALLLWIAALLAMRGERAVDFTTAASMGVGATMLWWMAARVLHQYDVDNGRGFLGDMALTVVMLAAMAVPLLGAALAADAFAQGGRFVVLLVVGMLAARFVFVGLRLRSARPTESIVIAGIGPLGRLTGAEIEATEAHRHVIGYVAFDDEPPHGRLRAPVIERVGGLEDTLKQHVVDEVYFATTASEHQHAVQEAIRTCEKFGVPFALPSCSFRLTRARPANASAVRDGYSHFLSVQNKPLQLMLKRAFDILLSATALVVLSPLLLGVAAIIKLTDRGPILFRQQRVGLHGRTFNMLKFRSMVVNAEALKAQLLAHNEQSGPVFKMKHDPRITRVGRFIRKFSIDELPQIVNVLRGDMSIVGPRPPLPNEVARYEAWQRRRLSVRPGLTCVWQVSGRNQISFRDWMLLDMRYIDHWSLAQDFQLILKTFPVVITGRGAS